MSSTEDTPIGQGEFAAAMARFAPFEDSPIVAVGVSGGRDSLALALLAAEWINECGGRAIGITVDHGLRAGSACEANRVSGWLTQRGIAHHTLTWQDGPAPGKTDMAGSEAMARSARYGLLEAFCRSHGILHLLVGHHRDDQAETQSMRRDRTSGVIGRAGMPAVRELGNIRILRPLLDFPRTRITMTLVARDQPWIDDPSNADLRFARARLRASRVGLAVNPKAGAARQSVERKLARIAARSVALHPAGFARVDLRFLRPGLPNVCRPLMANLLTCIGGSVYPPRGARLDRLVNLILTNRLGGGVTLGGCTIRPDAHGCVVIARELAAVDAPREWRHNQRALSWDGRFRVSGVCSGSQLGAAGQFRALGFAEETDSFAIKDIPHDVRMCLPAVGSGSQFRICGLPDAPESYEMAPQARFSPVLPVAGTIFATSG